MKKQKENRGIGFPKEYLSNPTNGINYLLVIGIDKYPNVTPLDNAVKDAKAVQRILVENYQFDPQNSICLFDEQATKNNILAQFDILHDKITNKDNLILYFAGHGELNKRNDHGYWIPYYGELNKRGTHLPNSEVISFFKNIEAKHIFAIVDSCFSGTLFKTRKVGQIENRLEKIPSRWVLTSGMEEPVLDGAPGQHSPFAKSLLTQLEACKETGVSLTQLSANVQSAVVNKSFQTPRVEPIQINSHEGGQFIFHPKNGIFQPTEGDKINAPIRQEHKGGNKPKGKVSYEHHTTPKPKKKELPVIKKIKNKTAKLAIGIGGVLLSLGVWFFLPEQVEQQKNEVSKHQDFKLITYIYSDKSKAEKVKNSSFNVEYKGADLLLKTNELGELNLDKIAQTLRGDSIFITPAIIGFQRKTISKIIPKHTDTLSITLQPETRLHGRVFEKNGKNPIPDAIVLIDGKYKTLTDEKGNYELLLPFKEGERKSILIKDKNGNQILFNKNELLTSKISKDF